MSKGVRTYKERDKEALLIVNCFTSIYIIFVWYVLIIVSVKFDSACIISYTRIELRRLEVNIYRFASKQHITDSKYISSILPDVVDKILQLFLFNCEREIMLTGALSARWLSDVFKLFYWMYRCFTLLFCFIWNRFFNEEFNHQN